MSAQMDAATPADARRVVRLVHADAPLPEDCGAEELGSKAWNLARMAALGLPVPPAFVIGTGWCAEPGALDEAAWRPALAELERLSGLRLGDARHPLLLSVRSGAPVSMPGMMETLLDIGLTETTLSGLLRVSGHPRLAWDAYRRLIAGYGEVVAGIDARHFDADLDAVLGECNACDERMLDFAALRALAARHLDTYRREAGEAFPQDAHEQLRQAIAAVFASWHADKARTYRAMHGLAEDMGTAVTVQRMVFGNAGGLSGAGVGFTRDPSSGEPRPWVDFLFNAQGEDVVSGRRSAYGHDELAAVAPAVWQALLDATARLERAFGDMQDFEFTVQQGVLHLLQTRAGKRTPRAAARIALDLLDEGVIDVETARARTATLDARALAEHRIANADGVALVPLGHAASAASGVACGARPRPSRRGGEADPGAPGRRDARPRCAGTRRGPAHPARCTHLARRGSRAPARQGLPGGLRGLASRRGGAHARDRRPYPARGRSADAGRQRGCDPCGCRGLRRVRPAGSARSPRCAARARARGAAVVKISRQEVVR